MKHISFLALVILVLSGCSSALIYETEKVAISIEARSDPSQPISGTFGAKQRVALVLPGKESGIGKPGEALSVVSYFNLDLDTGDGLNDDGLVIDTVLLTGEAASQFQSSDEKNVSKVFDTISRDPDSHKFRAIKTAHLALAYNGLLELAKNGDTQAGKHAANLDALSSMLPDTLKFNVYRSDLQSGGYHIPQNYEKGSPVKKDNFYDVIYYISKMDDAVEGYEKIIKKRGNLILNGKEIDTASIATLKKGFEAEKEITSKLRTVFKEQMDSNSDFDSARQYFAQIIKD